MSDVDESPTVAPRPHLLAPPDPAFWTDTLFFGRFDELLAASPTADAAEELLTEVFKGGPARATARAVIERAGGGLLPTQHLVVVGAFTELKHSDAIEAVAVARLGADVVRANRTPGGAVRRHALMALLYEAEPDHLLEVLLWHRHYGRRRARYRLRGSQPSLPRVDLATWEAAAGEVLASLRDQPASGCRGFDVARVGPGPAAGDVLVALREWPARSTGRGRDGEVATVEIPDWTTLHFAEDGRRVEVSDGRVDRGANFATALASRLAGEDRAYDLVLQPLSGPALDDFLARLTDPADLTFPLVEVVAEVPWRPHRVMTLTGTPRSPTELLVHDIRQLHAPFARDWRTVKNVKVRFEDRYTIQVHFPRPGEPAALSYSDDGRSERVSYRFSKMLEEHLHVEVAAKARRGARRSREAEAKQPRRHSLGWWRALLAPSTDRPAEWLEDAVAALGREGLVRESRARVFPCGSPYVDRRSFRVDSLDCDGEVILPHDLDGWEDPTQLEDDGRICCTRGLHRWRPQRYGLPTVSRLEVAVEHENLLAYLLRELGHYGEVRSVPGRPGVHTVRLDDVVGTLVYVPLAHADELDPEAHGRRSRVAWVVAPGDRPPGLPVGALELADVLADNDLLAKAWGTQAWKRRRYVIGVDTEPIVAAEPAVPVTGTRVLTLTNDGLRVGPTNQLVTNGRHQALSVLWALSLAATEDEGDRTARQLWSWERLDELLLEEWRAPGDTEVDRRNAWHRWISRTRKALSDGTGEPDLGKRVIASKGSKYRLGDGFVVVDERLRVDGGD